MLIKMEDGTWRWIEFLEQGLLGGMQKKKPVLSFVGAGGKTSAVYRLRQELCNLGERVLVVTTTHMFRDSHHCNVSLDPQSICRDMEQDGFVLAGSLAEDKGKIGPLPEPILEEVMKQADVVLVEADGSKRRPLKAPGREEPVILPQTTHIIITAGLGGIGQPISQCCHRQELVCGLLQAGEGHCVSVEDVSRILAEGYLMPLKARYPKMKEFVLLNQASDQAVVSSGREIAGSLEGVPCILANLKTREFYV